MIEIFGPESSGKTTLTLDGDCASAKAGRPGSGFIDVEHAPGSRRYAKKLGVNLDDLLVSQPSSGEEALRICETLVRSNALDVIVIDSVAALVTKSELEGEIGDARCRGAGQADEQRPSQTHILHFQGTNGLHFHQPDP